MALVKHIGPLQNRAVVLFGQRPETPLHQARRRRRIARDAAAADHQAWMDARRTRETSSGKLAGWVAFVILLAALGIGFALFLRLSGGRLPFTFADGPHDVDQG